MRRLVLTIVFAVTTLAIATTGAKADDVAIESRPETTLGDGVFTGKSSLGGATAIEPSPDEPPPLPWFWLQIRQAVEASEERLPHHREDEFYIVLSPTRVSNGFDTVAGVGVKGHF